MPKKITTATSAVADAPQTPVAAAPPVDDLLTIDPADAQEADAAARDREARRLPSAAEAQQPEPDDAQPDTDAIIAKEIAGEAAPAAPPAPRPGPWTSQEEFEEARAAAARAEQMETGLETPAGIPDPHMVWNNTLRKFQHAHKACGTAEMPCETCAQRREQGENGAVIDKFLHAVLFPGTEASKNSRRSTGATEQATPSRPLSPTRQAIAAIKAGADTVEVPGMDPAVVQAMLAFGRDALVAALEKKDAAEIAEEQAKEALARAQRAKEHAEAVAKAALANATVLQEIAHLEEEIEERNAEIAVLKEQLVVVPPLDQPQQPARATTTRASTGTGERGAPRRDGIEHPDQQWKRSVPRYLWERFNERFPNDKRPQSVLTPIAKVQLGAPLKDKSEVTDDLLDDIFALIMAQQ